ncbi:Molybdenum cofactor guanylyltransferase [uncultured delta proteobacterium]|uniref:Probable molybdenum cofactor guanylyltransferase n=1 Tax=uncultured delta proteobacterium TaxID=34034 RepID=A0A212JMN7_9DELT|nr:Molybdenum cofactor guanylyltransferase [uncultured delta proteobacterium]
MEHHELPTGTVLAGGKSSRLGRDKCALVLGGADMLTRTVHLLRKIVPEVAVIGREHPGAITVFDEVPGAGPVGAITTALRHARGPCLVLPCDLPFMRHQTLALLLEAWKKKRPDTLVTAFRHSGTGKKENLVAVYEPGALAFLEPKLQQNLLKIALIVPEECCTFVPVPPEAEEDFFNINRPEDLRETERRLSMP